MEAEVISSKKNFEFNYRGTKYVLSFVNVLRVNGKVEYHILEPKLNSREQHILPYLVRDIKKQLHETDLKLKREHAFLKILKKSESWMLKHKENKNIMETLALSFYAYRDLLGLDVVDSLYHDKEISAIFFTGLGKRVIVNHVEHGLIECNAILNSKYKLEGINYRLIKKSVELREDRGFLEDKAFFIISKEGSFYIRKRVFSANEEFLMKNKTITPAALAYLYEVIKKRGRILIIGSENSGKSNLFSALVEFIEKKNEVLLIERQPVGSIRSLSVSPVLLDPKLGVQTFYPWIKTGKEYIVVDGLQKTISEFAFRTMEFPGVYTFCTQNIETCIHELNEKIGVPRAFLLNLDIIVHMHLDRRVREIAEVLHYDMNSEEVVIKSAFVREEGKLAPKESKFISSLDKKEKIEMKHSAERLHLLLKK